MHFTSYVQLIETKYENSEFFFEKISQLKGIDM